MKLGRYRQLIELMKLCECSRPMARQWSIKTFFSSETNDQIKGNLIWNILGWVNQSLYKLSKSHDHDGVNVHAHIRYKPLKTSSLERVD